METWKEIPGYSAYEVSSNGRVRNDKGLIMKQTAMRQHKGYVRYRIRLKGDDGFYKKELVHRLVASAFIPNPEGLPQIDHINENPSDNRVENLRWCTGPQNSRFYMDNHQIEKPVYAYPFSGGKGIKFISLSSAKKETGVKQMDIVKCCEDHSFCCGYTFRFEQDDKLEFGWLANNTQDGESFRQLKEYPDYYISDCGRVCSSLSYSFISGDNKNRVILRTPEKKVDAKDIGELVLLTFGNIPSDEKKYKVGHIDGDKTNNNLYNLKWIEKKGCRIAEKPYGRFVYIKDGVVYKTAKEATAATGLNRYFIEKHIQNNTGGWERVELV